jgi:uncharacterized lipoprotein YddW (UPF0748 family)
MTKSLIKSLALLISILTFTPNQSISATEQNRAVWLSFPYWDLTSSERNALSQQISLSGANTVYLAVYGSAKVRWNSKALQKLGLSDIRSDLEFEQGVNALRANELRVVPWFEAGLSVYLSTGFPEKNKALLQSCGKDFRSGEYGGNVMSFLDPTNPEAISPILGALAELASHPLGFDEIQLDRFRYTRGSNKRICRAKDGTSNKEHINNLVKMAYKTIKKISPDTIVSASPVTTLGGFVYRQDWLTWAKRGYIDAISGQIYARPTNLKACSRGSNDGLSRKISLQLFKAELNQWMRKLRNLPNDFPFTAGIMAERFDDSECMLDQIRYARKMGIKDFSLWVSKVKPKASGEANDHIKNNLLLLNETMWGEEL